MMKIIIDNILEKLDLDYNYIVRKKCGNVPKILLGDLLKVILKYKNKNAVSNYFCIDISIINEVTNNIFPNINKNLKSYILSISDYKYCGKCKEYKLKIYFNKTNSKYDNLASNCKFCSKEYYQKNKEEIKKQHKIYYQKHKSEYIAKNAKRRAIKLQRTPKWVNQKEIDLFHINKPKGYHVDHEIPLQGELVSGLNVIENLQYLPAHDNLIKSNKFDIEAYNNMNIKNYNKLIIAA